MTVRTEFICDRCGNIQKTHEQFWTIGITANCALYPKDTFVEGKSMQVCRPCLESFGIYKTKKPDPEEKQEEEPSIEYLIREIIRRCDMVGEEI